MTHIQYLSAVVAFVLCGMLIWIAVFVHPTESPCDKPLRFTSYLIRGLPAFMWSVALLLALVVLLALASIVLSVLHLRDLYNNFK